MQAGWPKIIDGRRVRENRLARASRWQPRAEWGTAQAEPLRTIELCMENLRPGRGRRLAAIVARDENIVAEGVDCVTATNDTTQHAQAITTAPACSGAR